MKLKIGYRYVEVACPFCGHDKFYMTQTSIGVKMLKCYSCGRLFHIPGTFDVPVYNKKR